MEVEVVEALEERNSRPITYLTSGSLNQGFLCEEDGGVERYKGFSDMVGANIE